MELYHLLNRGVDKRQIFLDDADRWRFVNGLELFNDVQPAENSVYFFSKTTHGVESIDLRGRYGEKPKKRKPIIDIHGWCIMGNHYHLLLSERVEGGLTKFIMKLNVGYAKYFNEKYERVGTLFQGRTKKILINSDAHFLHILHYIHLNPLDFLPGAKDWRERRIAGAVPALAHLEKYRWSSYLDYCGQKNFPSVITTELFSAVFKGNMYDVREYLRELELEEIRDLTLE